MKNLFRSRPAQIGIAALAVLNFVHAGVMAQGATRAYFANDPAGRNVVSILSEAPLETMLTRTGAVEASIKINPSNVLDNPQARFEIDANTLDTGIAMRNEHMKSEGWLNTAKYPRITFTLTKALPTEATVIPATAGAQGKMPVEGELELHGVKKTVRAMVEVEDIPATEATKARLDGGLMHIRATFPLKLDDFGIVVPEAAKLKVANEQQVKVDIFASTGSKAPGWAG
jgi:polyisoprenoid-binding protein YceI